MNESIVDKACDTVGDLVICDDAEKNDAFTSIRQKSQGDIGVSDYNIISDEQVFTEIRQIMCKTNKNYQVNILIIMR